MAVRFAPSPTGYLHVGNARTAIINYLYGRAHAASFILRLDDTDTDRVSDEFIRAIEEDLAWLGIEWDRVEKQSERLGEYEEVFSRLREDGHVYPCFETPEELTLKRKTQLAAGKPPVYDRASLNLSDKEIAALKDAGRTAYWRFKLDGEPVTWVDEIHGDLKVETSSLSDPVLIRGDGRPLYLLSSVVDDMQMGITLIVRGEDHIANTAAQIQLFNAIGARAPRFGHHGLLTGPGGEPLSKRIGSIALRTLREQGVEPMALVSYLALIGTSDAIENKFSTTELLQDFYLSKISRTPSVFDVDILNRLNAKFLHDMPFSVARDRLADLGLPHIGEEFWIAIRPNLNSLKEVFDWWHIVHEPLDPLIDDAKFLERAADLLPESSWSGDTWKEWTKAISEASGRKGKDLFHPLRRALTARDQGPEMQRLLPLMGYDRAVGRLRGHKA
jgi:glutamyl-tRNA synthetase